MEELGIPARQKKVNVTIEYCVPCDYSEYALAAARELIKSYQHVIEQLTFKMGSKGVFEIRADDRVVFSRKATGRHPEPGEVLQSFSEIIRVDFPAYPG